MAIWDYLSININFILSSKAFPTGGINYKACNIASKSSSATRAVYTSDGNHYLQPVSAYTNRLGGANNPYSEEVYDTAIHSYSNASMYPAISTYATGGTSTSKAFPTGGINYTVCNLGSVYNTDNSNTPSYMVTVTNFEYYISSSGANKRYTSIPSYTILSTYYKSLSVNSNGSVTNGSYTFYPAISTYVINRRYKIYSM